jgi:hypothetical protein
MLASRIIVRFRGVESVGKFTQDNLLSANLKRGNVLSRSVVNTLERGGRVPSLCVRLLTVSSAGCVRARVAPGAS